MPDTASSTEPRYMFEQAWHDERARLTALERIWDPYTFENLASLGSLEGMRCLDVGAGGGSVAAWLRERVGDRGHIVAADLDTRFLEPLQGPNLEVRTLDVTADDLDPASFDLIHTRLLLGHLTAHREAIRRMTDALKPGGWLLLEEFDHVSFLPDPEAPEEAQAVWMQFIAAFERLSERRGMDLIYGRRLPSLLRQYGLEEVRAEGRTTTERGGVEGRGLLLLSVKSLRGPLVETGAIDDSGVDRLISLLEDPGFSWTSQIMVAAFGRKPGG